MTAFAGFEKAITGVTLVGSCEVIEWNLTDWGLQVTHPEGAEFNHAAVYKVSHN
jgi:hypothetical protein